MIDLGVMVPAQKILDAAKEHDADIIGLSGLITPSLDEMVNFAVEMERQGLEIPLLIGGATTSRAHTAVKVAPRRSGPVVWVKDASRSVPVAAALLDDKQRPALLEATEKDYASLRERHAQKNERPMLTLEKARANRTPIEWDGYTPPVPAQGTRRTGVSGLRPRRAARVHRLAAVLQRLGDEGQVPRHPQQPGLGRDGPQAVRRRPGDARHPDQGEVADCQRGDRVLPGERGRRRHRGLHRRDPYRGADHVAQPAPAGRAPRRHPEPVLGDYIAPKDTGLADYVGAFAVTAGLGSQDKIAEFKAANDDYSAILLESLADRLAEAFAERMHQRVRKEFWGFQPDEQLDNEALIGEKYVGIRPAPGYPACPEHTEKATLWELMDVKERTGIELTESMAMWPGAAVSGWYFSHPQSQYFVVGRLAQDQVADYAKRKGWTLQEAERWLAPNLGYNPED